MDISDFLDYSNLSSAYRAANAISSLPTVLGVTLILSLIGAILLLVLFLPKKNENRFTGFAGRLYHFLNFHSFWISPILKTLCIALMGTLILSGLYVMFAISFFAGLLMIALAAVVRLLYEMGYLFYSMREQLVRSNDYLRMIAGEPAPEPPVSPQKPVCTPQTPPVYAQTQPVQSKVCPNCGKQLNANSVFCSACGAKLQ